MSQATITIEKNVPVPARRGGRSLIHLYPFAQMSPGDSFEVYANGVSVNAIQSRLVVGAAKAFGRGNYTTRVNTERTAVRVWRKV